MSNLTLEERVAALEERMEELRREREPNGEMPWWERWHGAFKNSPSFVEAARLGAEYRKAQPTAADEYDREQQGR
jgi:hypothetical protein